LIPTEGGLELKLLKTTQNKTTIVIFISKQIKLVKCNHATQLLDGNYR